jgi:hypothetical protein
MHIQQEQQQAHREVVERDEQKSCRGLPIIFDVSKISRDREIRSLETSASCSVITRKWFERAFLQLFNDNKVFEGSENLRIELALALVLFCGFNLKVCVVTARLRDSM